MDTSAIIRHLCSLEKISVTTLESEMGFGNGSLTKGNMIRSDRLLALSKRFGVSMEYLMGETSSGYYQISPFEYELIRAYRKQDSLTQSMVDRLLNLEDVKKEAALQA